MESESEQITLTITIEQYKTIEKALKLLSSMRENARKSYIRKKEAAQKTSDGKPPRAKKVDLMSILPPLRSQSNTTIAL